MKKTKVLCVLLSLALFLALPGCSYIREELFLRGMDPGITVEVELECEFPIYEVQMEWYSGGEALGFQSTSRADGRSLSGKLLYFFLPLEQLPDDLKVELRFVMLGKGETYRPPNALINGVLDESYYVVIAGGPDSLYTLNDGFP